MPFHLSSLLRKWQFFIAILAAAILVIISYWIFAMPTVRVFAQEPLNQAEIRNDSQDRSKYTSVSSEFVASNVGLRSAINCATQQHDALAKAIKEHPAQDPHVDNVCQVEFTIFDISRISSNIAYDPNARGMYLWEIEYEGKFYWISKLP